MVDGGRYEDMTAMEAVADDEGKGSVSSIVELGFGSGSRLGLGFHEGNVSSTVGGIC